MTTSSDISGSSITSSSDTSTTVHEQEEEEEGVMTSSPSPVSSSSKNENRNESLQQTIPLQTNNNYNNNVKERTQSPSDKTTNHNGDEDEDKNGAVSSEPCCNTIKRRSWSMLELNEMKVIHGLPDDMEEILSLDKDDDDKEEEEEAAQEIQNVDFIFIGCDGNEDEKTDKVCDDKDVPMNNTLVCDESSVKECTERENGKRRNKGRNIQRGILKNLSLRRSMSMSMGSIRYKHSSSSKSLKDSKLQRSVGNEADGGNNDDENDNHQDDDLMGYYYSQPSACPSERVLSLDHSHHDYSNHHGMNLGKILHDGYCSNPSPLSITEYNGQDTNDWKDAELPRLTKGNGRVNKNEPEEEEEEVDADADTNAGADAVSVCAKRTLCRNRMNRISPSNYKFRTGSQSSTLALPTNGTKEPLPTIVPVVRHCSRERMPQSSILKKSTSMVQLNTSCNKHSTDITKQSYADCGKMRRVTSFSTLEIREYQVTIGDNPGGRQGPPLSLDWDYCEDRTVKIDIDRYEKMRPPRRKKHEMYMPGSIRMWTLMKYMGYSLREIEDASKAADSIRKKRAKSIKYQNIYDLQYRVGKLLKLGGRR